MTVRLEKTTGLSSLSRRRAVIFAWLLAAPMVFAREAPDQGPQPAKRPQANPERSENAGDTTAIQNKLDTIIIPRIDFEEATIHQVIRFLREKSRELDPEGKGVNIIFQENPRNERPAATEGNSQEGGQNDTTSQKTSPGKLTIAASDMPLGELVRLISQATGLAYRATGNALFIGWQTSREMEVRVFDVPRNWPTADAKPAR